MSYGQGRKVLVAKLPTRSAVAVPEASAPSVWMARAESPSPCLLETHRGICPRICGAR